MSKGPSKVNRPEVSMSSALKPPIRIYQNNLKLPFHKTSGRKLLNFTTNMYIQGVLHMSDFSSSSKTRS